MEIGSQLAQQCTGIDLHGNHASCVPFTERMLTRIEIALIGKQIVEGRSIALTNWRTIQLVGFQPANAILAAGEVRVRVVGYAGGPVKPRKKCRVYLAVIMSRERSPFAGGNV